MTFLGKQDKTIFIGQAVRYSGTGMSDTLVHVPDGKKIEFPVCEDMQQGFCNGLSLNGFIPISIFPRWNFLLLATNQIVNHLDKIPLNSDFKPKIIIRTSIGAKFPFNSWHQHTGDFSDIFSMLCKTIEVIRLDKAEQIFPAYEKAYNRTDGKSTILVEWGDAYDPNFKIEDYNKV